MKELLAEAYGSTTGTAQALADQDFECRTWTEAWTVRELLFHQLLDAQRALVALATPMSEPADVDEVTYWRPFRPSEGDGGAAHALFVQRAAAAYEQLRLLVEHWWATADAVVRAAAAPDPGSRVATQGHVITVRDLCSTLVVEACVHLLDLVRELDGGGPTVAVLAHTRGVLGRLYGGPLPPVWDDGECVLKATGRVPLTDGDRAALGVGVDLLPVLG